MNSQEYWRKRILYTKRKQLDHERDYELAMRARLRALENEIIKEARHWVSKYANENHLGFKEAAKLLGQIDTSRFDMTLKEFEEKAKASGFDKELNSAYYKSRIARLQKLQQQFIEFAGNYADKEEGIMAKALANQYQFTYDQDNYSKYLVTGGIDVDYAHFNEDQLRSIVYQPWQGSDFSKRIWNNYTNILPEVLTGTMFKATALGYSHSRIEQELRSAFRNVENNNLHRLIVTEMGHIAEQATADFYEDSDIEQYQYLATLEVHTCEICAHLDERIFYVKDRKPGLNYPLIHPYCRCTTVPYMEGLPDIESRWARDPETGKGKFVKVNNGPKRLTFREWKKLTVDSAEYHKIVDVLGDKAPVSLSEFLNLKYNDSESYKQVKHDVRVVDFFKSAKSKHLTDEQNILAIKLYFNFKSDGIVFGDHALERYITRNRKKNGQFNYNYLSVIKAFSLPPNYIDQETGRNVRYYSGIAYFTEPDTNVLVTMMKRKKLPKKVVPKK